MITDIVFFFGALKRYLRHQRSLGFRWLVASEAGKDQKMGVWVFQSLQIVSRYLPSLIVPKGRRRTVRLRLPCQSSWESTDPGWSHAQRLLPFFPRLGRGQATAWELSGVSTTGAVPQPE